ncbi:MAG: ATP-grasp domain-containing protein [Desulfamplus sp.]|nr:ATP-grasp domain-containing protein [Desulfamplus sp.]
MHKDQRVLVVGTTSDYIDLLRHKYPPKSLLFITSKEIRDRAKEESPPKDEEILSQLDTLNSFKLNNQNDHKVIISLIKKHVEFYKITLIGVACFDCESMAFASYIAAQFSLPYPPIEAVMACRDKSITRELWHKNQISTPHYSRVSSLNQALEFFHSVQENHSTYNDSVDLINNKSKLFPCVLKPIDSSGSERVFRCLSAKECESAYNTICKPQKSSDIIIERYVDGVEYSCDFMVGAFSSSKSVGQIEDKKEIEDGILIRLTRKIASPTSVFGTTMAYEILDKKFYLNNFLKNDLLKILAKAAKALGISRAICMVDFIVTKNGDIFLLEMTPRPGGDCLPWLIERAMNIDILKLNIEFAKAQNSPLFDHDSNLSVCNRLIGLRIHAIKSGILKDISTKKVQSDPRVIDIFIKHKPEHQIILPPNNYDSWNLGHIIFKPFDDTPFKNQCIELLSMLKVKII